jgi:hypothetical protein
MRALREVDESRVYANICSIRSSHLQNTDEANGHTWYRLGTTRVSDA